MDLPKDGESSFHVTIPSDLEDKQVALRDLAVQCALAKVTFSFPKHQNNGLLVSAADMLIAPDNT